MPNMVPVQKLATCKRCGDSQCAWLQNKAGKWYLASAYIVAGTHGEELVASKAGYHKCTPMELKRDVGIVQAERDWRDSEAHG